LQNDFFSITGWSEENLTSDLILKFNNSTDGDFYDLWNNLQSNDTAHGEFDDLWNNLKSNDTLHREFDDLWNKLMSNNSMYEDFYDSWDSFFSNDSIHADFNDLWNNLVFSNNTQEEFDEIWNNLMSNDNMNGGFDDLWNKLMSNDSTHWEFDDSWSNASPILTKELIGCMEVKGISDCMHLFGNISKISNFVEHDSSITAMYEQICAMASQEKIINSSSGYEKEIHSMDKVDFSIDPENGTSSVSFMVSVYVRSIIGIIGVGSNVIVILVIILIRRLRKPFYLSIVSLSISDILPFVHGFVGFIVPSRDICESFHQEMYFNISLYSVKMYSTLNVVLFASVRYVMFVYPLKSRVHLTKKIILILSSVAMVVSIAYGTMMRFIVWSIPFSQTRFVYIIDDCILILALVVLNIAFLANRLLVSKTSRAAHGLKFRMTLVVIIILLLHAIKSSFTIVDNVWRFDFFTLDHSPDLKQMSVTHTPNLDKWLKYSNVLDVFIKLVHCVNPFLYFFSSPVVIKGITSLPTKCNPMKKIKNEI
jgi:hypothetical protein